MPKDIFLTTGCFPLEEDIQLLLTRIAVVVVETKSKRILEVTVTTRSKSKDAIQSLMRKFTDPQRFNLFLCNIVPFVDIFAEISNTFTRLEPAK